MSAARHFAKSKPIIVVKSGRTARSALAAASHTGAIAGDDTLYSAVFRRAGVVRVDEIEDLFDASEALSRVSSPRGPRLGIVTNAGGPGVMACDCLLEPRRRARRAQPRDRREAQGRAARLRRARQPRRRGRRRRRGPLRRRRAGPDRRPQLRRRARHPHAAGHERPHGHRPGPGGGLAHPPAQAAAHVVHGRDQGRRRRGDLPTRARAHLLHARRRRARLHVHVPVHAQPREPLRDAGRHPARLRAGPRRRQEDVHRGRARRPLHPQRAGGQGRARGLRDPRRQDRRGDERRGVRRRPPSRSASPWPSRSSATTSRTRATWAASPSTCAPRRRRPTSSPRSPSACKLAAPEGEDHRRRRAGHEPRRLRGHHRLQEGPHLRSGAHVRHGRHRRGAVPRRGRRLPAAQPGAGARHDPEHQGVQAPRGLPRQGAGRHDRPRAGAGEGELPARRLPRDPRDGREPAAGAHRRHLRPGRAHRHRAQGRAQDHTSRART